MEKKLKIITVIVFLIILLSFTTINFAFNFNWTILILIHLIILLAFFSIIFYLSYILFKNKIEKKEKEVSIVSIFFNISKDGMFVTDKDGLMININKSFTKITNYELEDIKNKYHHIFDIKGNNTENFKEEIEKELLDKGIWEGEVWLNKKNGEEFLAWLSAVTIKNKKGKVEYFLGSIEDLTSYKEKQENISWLSNYDALTGLPNQTLFREKLNQFVKKYEINKKRFALMYIDVNNFKVINENLGYEKGDAVLFMLAERLKNIISPVFLLSRISGDHFLLLIPYFDTLKELEDHAKKILYSFSEKFLFEEKEFFINLSLGIAIYPEDLSGNESIIHSAFKALKHSKSQGKNSYQFYSSELSTNIKERLKMDSALRESIKNNELFLNYQPQLDLQTGEVVGMEALLRWKSKEFGLVSPMIFIPLAEENGMIVQIGDWVLSKACEDIKKILDMNFNIRISVNLSPIQFKQINLLSTIQNTLKKWEVPPHFVELEITEGIFLENIKKNIYILNEIRNMSIKIALDDFGTGYSSLSYLQNFKFDRLKLDQSFVRNMDKNENRKICETIIDLAHKLGLKAIAEGVETEEHFNFLKEKGCDEIQGYYFSRPISYEDVVELIKKTNIH
ncbi:MAG: EAL domain-containing protein [Fusobacteria bacterium]|nr:EAL domain-containing protein [Fusobacteriota bacterium]